MDNLPVYIYLTFGLTIVLALFLFYRATSSSSTFLALMVTWLIVQSMVGLSGFYRVTSSTPPRVSLLLIPPLMLTILLFSTKRGQHFIDSLRLEYLTFLHIIRVPVELVLYWLFLHKAVPELMTFEGRNFDILSGLTAPFIYYLYFVKHQLSKSILIGWNFICLGLLINIVTNAILSVPGVFQQFAFEQPNVAILYFPFIFLPGLLVPLVLVSHLASIRKLLSGTGS